MLTVRETDRQGIGQRRRVKVLAQKNARELLAPNRGGTSKTRVPSAEGVRLAFSSLSTLRCAGNGQVPHA